MGVLYMNQLSYICKPTVIPPYMKLYILFAMGLNGWIERTIFGGRSWKVGVSNFRMAMESLVWREQLLSHHELKGLRNLHHESHRKLLGSRSNLTLVAQGQNIVVSHLELQNHLQVWMKMISKICQIQEIIEATLRQQKSSCLCWLDQWQTSGNSMAKRLHPAMLAEKLHICHSISMPQFRKTHGIPVYLSNVVLAKLQTHHQSWLTCSQPGKPHRQKALSCCKVHYHYKTVSHWQHWCIHMSQEGIGSICKGPKREQLEATEEDRCLRRWFSVRRDRCVFYGS